MPAQNCVVTLTGSTRREHEHLAHAGLARRLAALLGFAFAGEYDPAAHRGAHVYFVPDETLLADHARRLGIAGPQDLFGGVVPYRFAATKALTHGVLRARSAAPRGWPRELASKLSDVVLAGYTAFAPADAVEAGRRLLELGAVRVKPAHLLGGVGQSVVADAAALAEAIAALDRGMLRTHGVVLEQNIDAPRVFSIGELCVHGLALAYFGTQGEVENHAGEAVYGGSDLQIVRGRMADLLALRLAPALRRAVEQACTYDAVIGATFPKFFASRRNYDVLHGRDAHGAPASGVLEQSWRIGGASPAEIAALQAFAADPGLRLVRASSREIYGEPGTLPDNADVHYDGTDAHAGRLCKFSTIDPQPFEPGSIREGGA